ncbi:MAG TPA: M20/M25/M40 family metallo-hydrolase [Vicinamibacterales bacterium]|nr:M20/M25/M40 family metallo-hydrolase [Vicinamibacterales bacterium]
MLRSRLLSIAVLALLASSSSVRGQAPVIADADPRIARLVAAVSEERLRALGTKLVSFGTRESMSNVSSSTRGIGAARQWIFDELTRSSPRLQVSFDTHIIAQQGRFTQQTELRNVMAVLPGRSPRRIYITGHYDSVNLGAGGQQALNTGGGANSQAREDIDHNSEAPGANDDGSGTVLTMELARVFAESGVQFDATLVFMCWAGEEQGLVGSAAHAQQLAASKAIVEANLNNDIVGNSHGGNGVVDAETVRIYSVGPEDSMSRSLARYVARMAAVYVPSHRIRLMAREDRFGRGSDHSSFTRQGYPAIVFREANENFSKQHTAADTLEGVDFAYLAQNARVNAAAAASLALAPPAPKVTGDRGQNLITRGKSGYDAHLQWQASPGAVAYRISWRDTWSYDWQHRQTIGNVTEYVLPNVSIDDFVFGVSAVSADGLESMTSAYVSPVRQSTDVKVVKP